MTTQIRPRPGADAIHTFIRNFGAQKIALCQSAGLLDPAETDKRHAEQMIRIQGIINKDVDQISATPQPARGKTIIAALRQAARLLFNWVLQVSKAGSPPRRLGAVDDTSAKLVGAEHFTSSRTFAPGGCLRPVWIVHEDLSVVVAKNSTRAYE
jgi:hypothetical protein